jgi:hypothetical protein
MLFKKMGEFEICLSNRIIGKENEIQQCVVTIKEQEDLIQDAMNQLKLIDQNWVFQHAMLREDIMHGLSAQGTYIFEWLTKAFEKQVNFLDAIKELTAESIKEKKFPEILGQTPIIIETRTNTLQILQMLPDSFDGIKQFITDNLGIIHGKIFDISRLIADEKDLNRARDISLELTNAAINSLGNDLSSLLYKLDKDRNTTIDTILRLARITWDSVDKLEAQFNSRMFFVARPEKIPERENQLTRNIFKLYLEVGIIIKDESESFQNEIRMILLTTREMVWS